MRLVSTRVLPEPAPATISRGVPAWVTAARWGSLRPTSNRSASGGGAADGTSNKACTTATLCRPADIVRHRRSAVGQRKSRGRGLAAPPGHGILDGVQHAIRFYFYGTGSPAAVGRA